jgi:hypothetical protein
MGESFYAQPRYGYGCEEGAQPRRSSIIILSSNNEHNSDNYL